MDYARRLRGLQEVMREQDTDLVMYGTCQNYQYLTGIPVDWRMPADSLPAGYDVFVPREGKAVATAGAPIQAPDTVEVKVRGEGQTYAQQVADIVKDLKIDPRKVGLGSNLRTSTFLAFGSALCGATFCDASTWMGRVRMIKEPEEIDKLRKVAAMTDHVMEKVIYQIQAGISQNEVMRRIVLEGRRAGAAHVSFDPFVGFMRLGAGESEHIANVDPDEGLEPDSAICFDVGFVKDGYCSDWGRSVYWGRPPDPIVAAHTALREAVLEVFGKIRDGSMRACDVYPAVERALDKRGHGDQMRRRLANHRGIGHSIGVEVHEHPWLGYTCEEVLRENMVIAIEPKLWVPGEYYLRLEEIVLVKRDGAEFLTNFDRDLFVL